MTETTIPNFVDETTLLPAIAQDASSGEVLMLAYMNRAAFEATVEAGEAVYFSRSRNRLWRKGETSGHVQKIRQILVDCDADTILLKVDQVGAACHEGYATCFFRQIKDGVVEIQGERIVNPQDVYRAKQDS